MVEKDEKDWRAPVLVKPNISEKNSQLFHESRLISPSDRKQEPEATLKRDEIHKDYTRTNLQNAPKENNQALHKFGHT